MPWTLARFILKYFERTWGRVEVDSVKMPKVGAVFTLG
jgi:hypothetical protein